MDRAGVGRGTPEPGAISGHTAIPNEGIWAYRYSVGKQNRLENWFDEWFQQIGITAQPMGAERLQTLMLQEGVRPEDNLFSRGIIAMREE